MPNIKERLYLINFNEELKNPSPNKYVLIYTGDKSEDRPVKKPTKNRVTLSQRMDQLDQRFNRLEVIVIDGFKQVNTRLDYIVQANNLKDIK